MELKKLEICFFLIILSHMAIADSSSYVTHTKEPGSFALSVSGNSTPLYVSEHDFQGVIRAAQDLKVDIGKVTNHQPEMVNTPSFDPEMVIIGTLGKSPVIDQLVKEKKLNVDQLSGKWESFIIQIIENPLPNVDKALVIVGSDKRGTIFGIYDLSSNIGVSPWYWWADVPVKKQSSIYILPGAHTLGEPKVKYRGIFINDEAPALSGWAFKTFGGFNHQFYEKVYELILRMKGNFLWPAMWGRAFYVEDSLNSKLADEYGVVIGTSHHEPMMRAHDEWRRFGSGAWNYEKNESELREFWTEGVKRINNHEGLVTIGMRGDGDEPMTEGTAISLLEKIVSDQREIIEEVTGKPASQIPQVWALYKEVQDYYDKGMRVPDDVILLLCDDNWGNIRKLPQRDEITRKGGFGIYYHYDYVGGPRNYKWINTNHIARVWEQMHLAYQYGANEIWIVNVGDIKPMEFPTEFFLDFAWNPENMSAEKLPDYHKQWAEKQFGPQYANQIGDFLNRYTKFNSRRKPELLSPETYSLIHYQEAERIVNEYNQLKEDAREVYDQIPEEYKDAYYQLVMYPIEACATINELYVTVAKNRLYAKQGRNTTNDLAKKAKSLFDTDSILTDYYNNKMANGKWSHMMDQTRIGYTYWQQPDKNVMPEVKTVFVPENYEPGVALEGSEKWWPEEKSPASLPEIDFYNHRKRYFELFNKGTLPYSYKIKTGVPWLKVSSSRGRVKTNNKIWVSVDWAKIPAGNHQIPVMIKGPDQFSITIYANINNEIPRKGKIEGFIMSNGYVSIEAANFSRSIAYGPYYWTEIPDLGRTHSAMTVFPVTAEPVNKPGDTPCLEYDIFVTDTGMVNINTFLSPTLNFHGNEGLRYAVSINDEEPVIINMHEDESERKWSNWVSNNIAIFSTKHRITTYGNNVLKFWLIDPGVVLQKLVVDTGDLKPSYLGPPESYYKPKILN